MQGNEAKHSLFGLPARGGRMRLRNPELRARRAGP